MEEPASSPAITWRSDPAPGKPPGEDIPPWPPWTAPAALVGGILLAALAAVLIELPALAFGVNVTSSHIPGGLEIIDTVVQDAAFVVAAVFFAQLGGRTVRAWQFGLRPPRTGWKRAAGLVVLLFFVFLIFSVIWGTAFHAEKDKLLEQLGTGESTDLLVLSAALTCVIAPICEEFLFRGYIFTALRNWHGTWPAAVITGLAFGGVHVGSAPVVDLVPLAGLGFGLCLLYRYTGSLYACIVAHSLNNSIAFGSLEGWRWPSVLVLLLAAFAAIGLIAFGLVRAGVITPERPAAGSDAFGVASGG